MIDNRIHYLYKELTGNTVEGDEMLTEYIRLLACGDCKCDDRSWEDEDAPDGRKWGN